MEIKRQQLCRSRLICFPKHKQISCYRSPWNIGKLFLFFIDPLIYKVKRTRFFPRNVRELERRTSVMRELGTDVISQNRKCWYKTYSTTLDWMFECDIVTNRHSRCCSRHGDEVSMEMQIASSLRLICRIYIDKRAMDFLFVAKTTGNGPLQSLLSSQRISNGRITIRGAVRQRRPSLTCGRRNRMFSFCIYYDFITDVLLSAVECVLIAWWATWETNGLHRRRFGRHIGHKRPCRNKLPASAHRWTN